MEDLRSPPSPEHTKRNKHQRKQKTPKRYSTPEEDARIVRYNTRQRVNAMNLSRSSSRQHSNSKIKKAKKLYEARKRTTNEAMAPKPVANDDQTINLHSIADGPNIILHHFKGRTDNSIQPSSDKLQSLAAPSAEEVLNDLTSSGNKKGKPRGKKEPKKK